ncbi:MAG: GNAT family N-acetyltransferase [Candidatus Thiodiazotropha sp. (ex Lucinoma aequizonata)]|nr:GNAT family N-acetyltransferase [Candidatus Thiodiazotropha sp. (ex Lucinoma aequizonata)]MCU7896365.1 GNAT family N-acetyltransferase [Candidatus Thiodiazotropha sp. (ex Lucinoma aequizonata)]MCU7904074.1 GNAT family N-acetyltransferase [Candidatus Thiodiazotropha sp. (ex Lucinoma aequizonata)]MCU7910195.1 GNAT family N-acetyltransferase [Candidatus Thiodiazotropha sp. (ex Lucinoma aequizonata)]MCU7911987.1 GNAT family N-acetyltransferase [Candidatus Thiodiazotropha sp. (ex Lucinoma aequizo
MSGKEAWCVEQAGIIVKHLNVQDCLWVGNPGPDGIHALTNAQALEQLGRECGLLVYNAYAGFDPDAFGALSGTLRGGSLLLLLTPPLQNWADYADPQADRIVVAGYSVTDLKGHFLQRISSILQTDPAVIRISPDENPILQAPSSPIVQPQLFLHPHCRTQDQAMAVEAIIHVVKGHRKRPLVLTSDRGRGKSSALGIAAAQLIREGYKKILVTAPRQGAILSLFKQASNSLPESKSSRLILQKDDATLRYCAADHLLADPQPADILFVDEAAAIPTPQLEGLLNHYPRIVFATTIHGYEGTGLGFNLRFKGHLDRKMPQWRELTLKEPIRWALKDPLEQLVFRLLALDASPADDVMIEGAQPQDTKLEFPSQQQLLEQECDLKQLFGLLILSHYRTTPLDLRHLLDGPNLQIALLRYGEAIVAVALLAVEGEFSAQMAEQIWAGRRRPRGHLLAQSLSAHLGLQTAATLKGLRIMRIAVHPAVQGKGLGSQLVEAVKQHASDQGFDYLGTSFGATPELIKFWRATGLHVVRLGLHAGASSSKQSVMLIQPLTPAGEQLCMEAKAQFARQLPALLNDSLRQLSTRLAIPLLKGIEHPSPASLEKQEWVDLVAFAFARRGYDITLHAIEVISLSALAEGRVKDADATLLIKRVLQKQAWQICASSIALCGRGPVEKRLSEVIGRLVVHYGDNEILNLAHRTQELLTKTT